MDEVLCSFSRTREFSEKLFVFVLIQHLARRNAMLFCHSSERYSALRPPSVAM